MTTNRLAIAVANSGGNINTLVAEFDKWKAGGSATEYTSPLFGKDSAYIEPTVDGKKYTLRHVHLVPVSNLEKLAVWKRRHALKSRKTSDRALIYADDGKGDYLLIYILEEPDGHDIPKMKTKADQETMEGFAEVAAAFIEDGKIIA